MLEDFIHSESYYSLLLCVEPTIVEGLRFSKDLIIVNLLFRLVIQTLHLPKHVCHSLSLVLGVFLIFYNVGYAFLWTVCLSLMSYVTISILSYFKIKFKGNIILFFTVSFLLISEMFVINPKMWQQIRGVQMLAAMKIISITFDLDAKLFKKIFNPVEFFGYVLCPANCILGPWIPFSTYDKYMTVTFWSFKKLCTNLFLHLLLSLIFLVSSNCLVNWSIEDNNFKWLVAYRDALSFRTSHYFISYLSMVSMICAGFDSASDLKVTRPYHIEFPRSLSQVVTNWNIPMHQWLKKYIFKICQKYGQFTAVTITYLVSSMLHGLNFQLASVLLSIGLFSYMEYISRNKISTMLNACCLANPCNKKCSHVHKKHSLRALMVNGIFCIITVINLSYLGVMFEASFLLQETGYSYYHLFTKWRKLDFSCHILALVIYIISFIL